MLSPTHQEGCAQIVYAFKGKLSLQKPIKVLAGLRAAGSLKGAQGRLSVMEEAGLSIGFTLQEQSDTMNSRSVFLSCGKQGAEGKQMITAPFF